MMTRIKLTCALVTVTSFVFCATAQANRITIDFNNLSPGTVVTNQYSGLGVDFIGHDVLGSSGSGGPDVTVRDWGTTPDNYLLLDSYCNGEGYIQANFSVAVDYVAVDFYQFEYENTIHHHLELYDAIDNLLTSSSLAAINNSWQTVSAQAATPTVAYARFYGWDNPVLYDINAVRNDNFTFGTAPVPEPATILLFGTGLAGLVGSRLLRRKKGDRKSLFAIWT